MKLRFAMAAVSMLFLALSPAAARGQSGATVVPETAAQQQVEIQNVIAAPERVQGVVVNHTDAVLKDVALLVRYEWLWHDERNPGEDTMSFGDTLRIAGDVPPGGTAGFSYMPVRELPTRQDGYYRIGVSVQSFRKSRGAPAGYY